MVSPLLPLLLSAAYFGEMDRPSRLFDQEFGVGLRPEDLMYSRYYLPTLRDRGGSALLYYRPWADLLRPETGGGVSAISIDKENFKIILDVQQFKPEEIEVKVVDRYIVVTAKHEEKKDEHGLISRQFVRRYAIPDNVDEEHIKSEISSDGVLTIQAPIKELPEDKKNERKIQIEYTGKPALVHEPKKEEPGTTTTESTESATTESTGTSGTTEQK